MYSYLFTEAELESRLLECHVHVQCECADRQFIDVCSCKAPAGEGQRSLSQMDDKHRDGEREGGFCRQLVSVNFCLSLS